MQATEEPKVGIVISRLQPLLAETEHAIMRALADAPRAAMLVLRSDSPRSIDTPLTYDERVDMLRSAFGREMQEGRLLVAPVPDRGYDVEGLREAVLRAFADATGLPEASTVTFTAEAGQVSRTGPANELALGFALKDPYSSHNASRMLCSADGMDAGFTTDAVSDWISGFRKSAAWASLHDEWKATKRVNGLYGMGPFNTADAVCIADGHVLLIRRGNAPYKGMLALPGGIVDQGENPRAATIRELLEETAVGSAGRTLTPQKLDTYIEGDKKRFDDLWRDPRGHYISNAYLFRMPGGPGDYTAQGMDDAVSAEWYPLSELKPADLAFDHFALLNSMIGLPYPAESAIIPAGAPTP